MVWLSLPGTLLLFWAAWLARSLRSGSSGRGATDSPPVTILKPLYGAEPRLFANLSSFLRQDHEGAVQVIFGVQCPGDPAIATVEALKAANPDADIRLVVDSRAHGANGKISNLTNMMSHASHDIIIMSDSDMAVPHDYLTRLVTALSRPGTGAVSCLYHGRNDAGFWSRMVGMGISQHFLPSALIGLKLGLASPCMGSTIAIRREALDSIGGFAAFADTLADDHAIGAAVRAKGLAVTVPDLLLTHGCAEKSLPAFARQELRWQATIAGIDPAGYAGSLLLHPFPIAFIGSLLLGFPAIAIAATLFPLAARAAFALQLRRVAREDATMLTLIPLRDFFSFVLFFAAFFIRSVDWRGARLRLAERGRLSAQEDID